MARLSCCFVMSAAALYAAQASRLLSPSLSASVQGRVTVVETIAHKTAANPVRDVKVYLFTQEASQPFQELQQRCRRAMARPDADPVKTFQVCDKALAEAFDLVPRLQAMTSAQTDRDGSFHFESLTPGRTYRVVGIKPAPGQSPIVVVGKTAPLRAGEHITLDLSVDDPWTGPLELK